MPIFMKAGSIKGDVHAKSHQDWILVESCSMDLSFDEEEIRKNVSGVAPEPEMGTFEVVKSNADAAVTGLMQWMVDGDELDKVELEICGDSIGDGHWRTQLRYILTNVVLSDYSVDLSNGETGELSIKLSLSYKSMTVEYLSSDKKQKRQASSTVKVERSK